MTKEKILTMEAGTRLDCIVARKVMDWKAKGYCGSRRAEVWKDSYGNNTYYIYGWKPSTDIIAAWEVIDKMREELFSRRYFFLNALQEQTKFVTTGTGENMLVAWPDVFWKVTPETICKAALLSKFDKLEEV